MASIFNIIVLKVQIIFILKSYNFKGVTKI